MNIIFHLFFLQMHRLGMSTVRGELQTEIHTLEWFLQKLVESEIFSQRLCSAKTFVFQDFVFCFTPVPFKKRLNRKG